MADFVADHRANTAEILGHIRVGIEERRAKDRSRERDVIDHRVIESVDHLSRGHPLGPVRRVPHLGDLIPVAPRRRASGISYKIFTMRGKLQVVVGFPLIRVGNFCAESPELLQRAIPRIRRHPIEAANPLAVRLQQVVHQGQHLLLVFRREMARDELPADIVGNGAIEERHRALPPGSLLGRARQHAPVEVKRLAAHVLGQQRRTLRQDLPPGP